MYELGFIILVAVVAVVIGILIGASVHRSFSQSESKIRDLTKDLEAAEAKNADYQQQVVQHFSVTANLFNDLTEKYKDIHHHLASGADSLCRDDDGQTLLENSSVSLGVKTDNSAASETEEKNTDDIPQAPLDYAPKTTADTGTLSEEFGLEKVKLASNSMANNTDNSAANEATVSTSEAPSDPSGNIDSDNTATKQQNSV